MDHRHSPVAHGITDEEVDAAFEEAIGYLVRRAAQMWKDGNAPSYATYAQHLSDVFGTGFGIGYRRASFDRAGTESK